MFRRFEKLSEKWAFYSYNWSHWSSVLTAFLKRLRVSYLLYLTFLHIFCIFLNIIIVMDFPELVSNSRAHQSQLWTCDLHRLLYSVTRWHFTTQKINPVALKICRTLYKKIAKVAKSCQICLVHTNHQCDQIGRFLHFGQQFKASGNNYFNQKAHIVSQCL